MNHDARLEKYGEQEAMREAKRRGYTEYKFVSTIKGVPDRVLSKPATGPFWVEWKRPGEKVKPGGQQELRHAEMRDAGMRVFTFDNYVKFCDFLDHIDKHNALPN